MEAPYGLPANSHQQVTSTGTSDVHTLSRPSRASGVFITVQTNNVYLTLDGSVPSSSNGLHVVKDTAPIFLPFGENVKVASDTAGPATVSAIWAS